jgi:CubicO group peptidase (beta-lactamase class C family)
MYVQRTGSDGAVTISQAKNPIRIVDLFTMSSGISYNATKHVEILFDESKGNFTNKELSAAISKDPLYFEPGTHWHYGYSHDILAYLIEVISQKTLGEYFYENIFAPLSMNDTFFYVPENKQHRLASCYTYDENSKTHVKFEGCPFRYFDPEYKYESGGGGLISSVDDYAKFANALCLQGTGDKYRLLSKATIDLMRENHFDDVRMKEFYAPFRAGYGFGLGVRTLADRTAGGNNSSIGEFGWSGYAGTSVIIDPSAELVVVYMQSMIPSKEDYVFPRLRNVVYGCL